MHVLGNRTAIGAGWNDNWYRLNYWLAALASRSISLLSAW